eukprot:scaffold24326_cov36-Cyclotella_meneghiniana.AAC.2
MEASEEAGGEVQAEPMGIAIFLIASEEKYMVEDVWVCCEESFDVLEKQTIAEAECYFCSLTNDSLLKMGEWSAPREVAGCCPLQNMLDLIGFGLG